MKYYNIGMEQFLEKAKLEKPKELWFDRHWNRVHFWFDEPNYVCTISNASDIVLMFKSLFAAKINIVGVNWYHSFQ